MAKNPSNGVNMYYLEIDKEHKAHLAGIRHFDTLKIAFEGESVWVKDILPDHLNAPEMHHIPYKTIYDLKENLLFKKGSLLPAKKLPSGLLWTPILRALPVALPKFNHNYFGIDQKIEMQLKVSYQEREAYALLADYDEVKSYIETAPDFRLKPLNWLVVVDKVLILGAPLLPIKGKTFWRNEDFLIPTGYDFEYAVLSNTMQNILNPSGTNLFVWQTDNEYVTFSKTMMKPMSISSFRLTFS